MRSRLRKVALVLAALMPGQLAAAAAEPETLRLGHAAGRGGSTVSLALGRRAQLFAFRPDAGFEVALTRPPRPQRRSPSP